MKLRRIAGLMAALAACAAAPASAAAVSVRVEGSSSTLVPRTQVDTNGAAVVKDGNPAHSCAGSSAAGALERATAGSWSGPWYDGLGYAVETIQGETHAFSSGAYWALWENWAPAQTGLCDTGLEAGDDLLLFPDCATAGCQSPTPLRVSAPDAARSGEPFTVTVQRYVSGSGGVQPQPAAGATVTAGGRTYQADADGRVQVTSRGESVQLRATQDGSVRSATESVCLSDNDGRCGTAVDDAAPVVRIHTPKHDRKPYRRGPRVLRGGVSADPSGLRHVKLRLNRTHKGKCYAYGSRRRHFQPVTCGEGWFFSIGADEDWRYELPRRLPRGRYLLKAVAIDGAGNRSRSVTGRNRVVFRVS